MESPIAAVIYDVETTTFQKGNPFARQNRVCLAGCRTAGESRTSDSVVAFEEQLRSGDPLVGFNLKFDLHWARRSGLELTDVNVWDCQLAHFLLTHQKHPYPALDDVLAHYGLPPKDDVVAREYWDKGIDTPNIPHDVLNHYLLIDLERTEQVYHKQLEEFQHYPKLYTLFRLHCRDLLVLQEMEWNGLLLNVAMARQKAQETTEKLSSIEQKLAAKVAGGLALNWDSGDDLSCFLYGGNITRERREMVGVYKTGAKVGQPRYRVYEDIYPLPRLAEPIKGSELKKEGYFSTDEKVLKQLKGVKAIVDLLLKRAKLSKLLDYYNGLPDLIEKMDWNPGELHGQLHQCVAVTGRLSATNPNQQNQPPEAKLLLESRY